MRFGLQSVILACGLSLINGCAHKKGLPAPPPEATAPTEEPTPPTEQPKPAPAPAPATTPAPASAKATHPVRKPKPKPSPDTPSASGQPQVAANSTPGAGTAASAIGQLSEGGTAGSDNIRSKTADLIDSTERGLKGITRSLSPQEHKTASQVSNFLQQARDALRNQDVDAAHTLATKAKLLLDELLK